MAGHEDFVERVLEYRFNDGAIQFLVRWEGYGPEEDSWEPWENLQSSSGSVNEFLAQELLRVSARITQLERGQLQRVYNESGRPGTNGNFICILILFCEETDEFKSSHCS